MKRLAIFLFLMILFSIPAVAAEVKDIPVSLKVTGSHWIDADFSTSGGSASVSTGNLSAKAMGFSFSYEAKKYNWSDAAALNFGNGSDDPWDTLHRIALGYEKVGRIDSDWNYMAALTVTSSFEDEMSGSYGAALRGGFMYKLTDHWSTLFGARIFTNSIRSSGMPFLGFLYKNIDEVGAGWALNIGAPSSEAAFSFSKEAKLRWNINLDGRTYRLKDDSTVASKGYIQASGVVTGVHFDWNPTKSLSLSIGPEYTFSREIKLFDRNGDKINSKIKQDSALGARLQIGLKF